MLIEEVCSGHPRNTGTEARSPKAMWLAVGCYNLPARASTLLKYSSARRSHSDSQESVAYDIRRNKYRDIYRSARESALRTPPLDRPASCPLDNDRSSRNRARAGRRSTAPPDRHASRRLKRRLENDQPGEWDRFHWRNGTLPRANRPG